MKLAEYFPARVEVNRGFPHLVLDRGTGDGEWLDHDYVEVFANIADTVTVIVAAEDDLAITPAEARALARLLEQAASAADEQAASAAASRVG